MSKISTAALIAEGANIKTRLKLDAERLKEIEADILSLGDGEHTGNDGARCQVITPAATIKLAPKDVDAVKEIAGADAFPKLFERGVTYKAVKAFRDVLAAIVGKREQKRILALTEKESTSYVKWD